MGGKAGVGRDFPLDFSALKRFSVQPPQKPTFTEREENDTNPRRLLFKYITDTGFSGALTTQEVEDICVIRC